VVEVSSAVKIMLNKNTNFNELVKELRKTYGLGKDLVCMNIDGVEYEGDDNVYQFRKNLWLGRESTVRITNVAR
jgi:hypothetical protein